MVGGTAVGIASLLNFESPVMSLGKPSPFYDIAIESDTGGDTSVGETGNLLIRGIPGVSLFAGYLHNEEATKSSFNEDSFFITGDRVMLLKDGSIQFADRSKDMLKVGGENVAASEIEVVIMSTGIVQEVAVVAKKDAMLDQVLVAFLIPVDKNAEENDVLERVVAECKSKLADFKQPREVRVVPKLPRATMNKISKNALREILDNEE